MQDGSVEKKKKKKITSDSSAASNELESRLFPISTWAAII